jgi:hypothetical protein
MDFHDHYGEVYTLGEVLAAVAWDMGIAWRLM